jgi:hypothetical protein
MDDRFDRRELLLHLGDMLEALSYLGKFGRPDAAVEQLEGNRKRCRSSNYCGDLPRR